MASHALSRPYTTVRPLLLRRILFCASNTWPAGSALTGNREHSYTSHSRSRVQRIVFSCSAAPVTKLFNSGNWLVQSSLQRVIPDTKSSAALSLRWYSTSGAQGTTRSTSDDGSSSSSSDSSSSSESEDNAQYDSVEDIRLAVMDAALDQVHDLGWTPEAIARGAEQLGYSSMAHGMVEGGGAELFLHLQERLNQELEQQLQQWTQHGGQPAVSFVEAALQARLRLVEPWLPVWSAGVITATLSPPHALKAVEKVAQLADAVCHFAGDMSTGPSWYTKRISVAAVYKASELCLLQDQSADHKDTWEFVSRRCAELERCSLACTSAETLVKDTATVARAAVLTGMNMAGFNKLSR